MLRPRPLLSALAFALCACGPAATYVPREGPCTARPPDCAFAIISGRSPERYEVVGVIDIEAFAVRRLPNDEATFRAAVGPAVCKAGGDAVIAGINGDGRYILATVVKWNDGGKREPLCPKPPPKAKGKGKGDAGVAEAGAAEAGVREGGVSDASDAAAAPATDAAPTSAADAGTSQDAGGAP